MAGLVGRDDELRRRLSEERRRGQGPRGGLLDQDLAVGRAEHRALVVEVQGFLPQRDQAAFVLHPQAHVGDHVVAEDAGHEMERRQHSAEQNSEDEESTRMRCHLASEVLESCLRHVLKAECEEADFRVFSLVISMWPHHRAGQGAQF